MKNTHYLIRLHGRVDRAMFDRVREKLALVPKESSVFFHINSQGGELQYARLIAQLISMKSRETETETIAIGYGRVDSAAIHIFVSCTFRVAYEHTRFFLHMPFDMDFPETVMSFQKEEVEYLAHMVGRPVPVIHQLMEQGVDLDLPRAANLGIVNLVISKKTLEQKRRLKP